MICFRREIEKKLSMNYSQFPLLSGALGIFWGHTLTLGCNRPTESTGNQYAILQINRINYYINRAMPPGKCLNNVFAKLSFICSYSLFYTHFAK